RVALEGEHARREIRTVADDSDQTCHRSSSRAGGYGRSIDLRATTESRQSLREERWDTRVCARDATSGTPEQKTRDGTSTAPTLHPGKSAVSVPSMSKASAAAIKPRIAIAHRGRQDAGGRPWEEPGR